MTTLTHDQAADMYIEMLDESGPVTIAGLEYLPSAILSAVDPIAYRCGFVDYMDAVGIEMDDLQ